MAADHPDEDLDTQRRLRRRARSEPLGVPVLAPPAPRSARIMAAVPPPPDADELDSQDEPPAAHPLELRVVALERSSRGQRRKLIAALIAALGSVGAVIVWALNAREAAGAEKERIRQLERDVERIELYVFPPPSLLPGRRAARGDDQPDPPAPQPAPKGTSP